MQDKTTFNQEGAVTSGAHLSYWLQTAPHLEFSVLDHDIETDVLIVGGGISGLTTAYYLLEYGLNIVLIDDGYIGSGESGRTTAHITCMLDEGYYKMETLFGKTKARKIAESHSQAINDIEHIIAKEKISCAFRRVDGYLFPHESDSIESLEREYNSIKNAGIEVGYLDNTPFIPSEINMPCLKIPNQGQFHIIRYLRGLAASIIQKGGEIFTQTKAIQIDALGTKTQEGNYIRSKNIVVATHSPINNTVKMHTKQFPYRTYVIGGLIPKGSLPYALWWDTGDQNSEWQIKPYHYVRVEEYDDGNDVLLIGGEDHKTGQAEEEQLSEELRYTNLIEWAKVHFPIFNTIDYRWSGQIMEPVDGLAFLGKNPGDDNTYIITGDSGNGITYSTIGAKLIADMIKGIPNPYQDIYDPSRFSINKLSDYINEIANMAYQYKDWFQSDATAEINNIKKDEAAIISLGLKKLAIYRDLNDEIHSFSAVCTHLGCIVRWNGDEKTFDCPCHGSRFNINGEVINGPAIKGLKKLDLESDKK